jgi:TolB protein
MRALKGISLPRSRVLFLILLFLPFGWKAGAQDWVRTGTNLGAARIRLAAADFNPAAGDAQTPALKTSFDSTLYNDLNNAGIFDMVSKSMAPPVTPASPQQMNLAQWAAAPASAAMVAFGSFAATGGRLAVYGYLFDAKNPDSPQILGKQYNEAASQDNARLIAHRFADEIITRLGGGISGIAETHIYYVAKRGGNKEIWQMDYDGQGQHAITRLGTISLSPRVSPDNDRIAFASLERQGWAIRMFSLVLGRPVSFPSMVGNTLSPAWSSNGAKIAFSASRSGDPEIFTADASGANVKQITTFKGPDVSPTWNPKRPHRPAPDLHDGLGWHQRAAPDGRWLCHFSLLVAERAVSRLCLEPQIRSGRTWRSGHLHHGHCQQTLDPAHARRGPPGLPFLVPRRAAHRISTRKGWRIRDLDHAC